LSKVLHRKASHSLVLHDIWVNACYVGAGAPVPTAQKRTWAEYMTAVTIAIGNEIRAQQKLFEHLDAFTAPDVHVSHIRLLDVIAWKSQGRTPTETDTDTPPAGRASGRATRDSPALDRPISSRHRP
jgi:hypothetical protein